MQTSQPPIHLPPSRAKVMDSPLVYAIETVALGAVAVIGAQVTEQAAASTATHSQSYRLSFQHSMPRLAGRHQSRSASLRLCRAERHNLLRWTHARFAVQPRRRPREPILCARHGRRRVCLRRAASARCIRVRSPTALRRGTGVMRSPLPSSSSGDPASALTMRLSSAAGMRCRLG
jgi:hypothetical protein